MARKTRRCGDGTVRRGCGRQFTPGRFRPRERRCDRCRSTFLAPAHQVEKHGHVTTYRLGLFGDPAPVAHRASLDGGPLAGGLRLHGDFGESYRRLFPAPAERADEDEAHRRNAVLDFVATPAQQDLLAAIGE